MKLSQQAETPPALSAAEEAALRDMERRLHSLELEIVRDLPSLRDHIIDCTCHLCAMASHLADAWLAAYNAAQAEVRP